MTLLLVDIAQTCYVLHVQLGALLFSLVPYIGPADTISRHFFLAFCSNKATGNYAEKHTSLASRLSSQSAAPPGIARQARRTVGVVGSEMHAGIPE